MPDQRAELKAYRRLELLFLNHVPNSAKAVTVGITRALVTDIIIQWLILEGGL